MNRKIDLRAERITKLIPRIMGSIVKIHQERILMGMYDDTGLRDLHKIALGEDNCISLTFHQYLALMIIRDLAKCSVNELANKMKIAQSTASQLIDRLVKSGFVHRETHLEDRRKSVVSLSKTGMKMLDRRTKALKRSYKKILSVLNDAEQRTFEEGFKNLYSIMMILEERFSAS
jgi:DNA-binding MarR family transcriptional regulator